MWARRAVLTCDDSLIGLGWRLARTLVFCIVMDGWMDGRIFMFLDNELFAGVYMLLHCCNRDTKGLVW